MVRPVNVDQKGFTLVELMLVIILIGTLSAMAARPLTHTLAYQTEIQMHEIALALDYAHMFAIQTGCTVTASFLPDQLVLNRVEPACHRGDARLIHPGTLEPYVVQSAKAALLTYESERSRHVDPRGLTFYASGRACNQEGYGEATVTLSLASGDEKRLRLNCLTSHTVRDVQ